MKPLFIVTLFMLLLSACAPSMPQVAPLPAVDRPSNAPVGETPATPQVKVVEMATQTLPAATLPPIAAAPTVDPALPTFTSTAPALPKTLDELGIPATTYEDKVGGLAFDYPSSWQINALADADKQNSYAYTASLRSVDANRGPKQQEGIPPDMAAIDVTVVKNGPKTLEQAINERRAAATTNEAGLPVQIAIEEDWVLRDGTKAHYFLFNLGKDPLGGYGDRDKMTSELVTMINGNMVLVSGMGDLSLFNVVAASLRQISPGK